LKNQPILLFYDGFELKARESLAARLFHHARCTLRAAVRKLRGQQVNTGFFTAFAALVDGLRKLGCDVRINDFATARRNPKYPIGIAGFPSVFEHVQLPNPVIFGPGDPGFPDDAGAFAAKENTRFIIQPSDWFVNFYKPYCGDKLLRCPVGVAVDEIPDTRDAPKSLDMLIYDKIQWNRSSVAPQILERIRDWLEARNLSYTIIQYGSHTQSQYFELLQSAKSMAWLSQHETQGLACAEAMAMNVPVLAWDEGELMDPKQRAFATADLQVSSVPYFDERCGVRFQKNNIAQKMEEFWKALPSFQPRDYVSQHLQPAETAKVFHDAYFSLAPEQGNE